MIRKWIYAIRNFDKIKEEREAGAAANVRKKEHLKKFEEKIAQQKATITSLRQQLLSLRAELLNYAEEPARRPGCSKPRIDGEAAAKDIRNQVTKKLGKQMYYYHCRKCPPSPLTHQRYYHLTSMEQRESA